MDSRPIVLIVEDEPLIGLSVQEWLDEAGYEIRLRQSALEALHELESAADVLSALVTDALAAKKMAGRSPDGRAS